MFPRRERKPDPSCAAGPVLDGVWRRGRFGLTGAAQDRARQRVPASRRARVPARLSRCLPAADLLPTILLRAGPATSCGCRGVPSRPLTSGVDVIVLSPLPCGGLRSVTAVGRRGSAERQTILDPVGSVGSLSSSAMCTESNLSLVFPEIFIFVGRVRRQGVPRAFQCCRRRGPAILSRPRIRLVAAPAAEPRSLELRLLAWVFVSW